MRCKLLLLLLLCSCATQRQAEKYFDEHPDELAKYVDENEEYTRKHGAAYAAKHFPPKLYAPAVFDTVSFRAERSEQSRVLIMPRDIQLIPDKPQSLYQVLPGKESVRTVYVQNTVVIDSLERELSTERLANSALKKKLKVTSDERDYWQEMNRKKRWAIVAMIVFAALYILFKILESRVREA